MYIHHTLSLGHWSAVHGGCSMEYAIRDGSKVDFMFGEPSAQYFELTFDAAAFREFIPLAGEALQKLDAEGDSKGTSPGASMVPGEAVTTGERSV